MKPRCKKCGRVLTGAVSIARGMGPKCAGIGSNRGKKFHLSSNHAHGTTYQAIASSRIEPVTINIGDVKEKCKDRERELRKQAFETHAPVILGPFSRKHLTYRFITIYKPVDAGKWEMQSINEDTGELVEAKLTTTDEGLKEFLMLHEYI